MKALEPQKIGLQVQQVLEQLLQQLSWGQQQAELKVAKKLMEQLQRKVQKMLQLWLLLPPLQLSFLPAGALKFNVCWQLQSDVHAVLWH